MDYYGDSRSLIRDSEAVLGEMQRWRSLDTSMVA
jgi:hypothetical protein